MFSTLQGSLAKPVHPSKMPQEIKAPIAQKQGTVKIDTLLSESKLVLSQLTFFSKLNPNDSKYPSAAQKLFSSAVKVLQHNQEVERHFEKFPAKTLQQKARLESAQKQFQNVAKQFAPLLTQILKQNELVDQPKLQKETKVDAQKPAGSQLSKSKLALGVGAGLALNASPAAALNFEQLALKLGSTGSGFQLAGVVSQEAVRQFGYLQTALNKTDNYELVFSQMQKSCPSFKNPTFSWDEDMLAGYGKQLFNLAESFVRYVPSTVYDLVKNLAQVVTLAGDSEGLDKVSKQVVAEVATGTIRELSELAGKPTCPTGYEQSDAYNYGLTALIFVGVVGVCCVVCCCAKKKTSI